MKPFLSVIIPAYNEAERLPLTLVDVDKHLSAAEYSYEIIVVDDGSRDTTVAVAKHFAGIVRNLRVVENEKNRGKGAAVRQGMLEAKGNWRLFMDADNSTSVDQVEKMLPYFSAGGGSAFGGKDAYDVIIASRAIPGAELEPPEPLYKQLLGKAGNLFIQLVAVRGICDTQCGFKCFSEEAAERIFGVARSDRWAFDVEALALARRFGFRIKEVPARWVNDFRSHVKLSAYVTTLFEVVRIRWWLISGVYEKQTKRHA